MITQGTRAMAGSAGRSWSAPILITAYAAATAATNSAAEQAAGGPLGVTSNRCADREWDVERPADDAGWCRCPRVLVLW